MLEMLLSRRGRHGEARHTLPLGCWGGSHRISPIQALPCSARANWAKSDPGDKEPPHPRPR